jgi:hypothetical protein
LEKEKGIAMNTVIRISLLAGCLGAVTMLGCETGEELDGADSGMEMETRNGTISATCAAAGIDPYNKWRGICGNQVKLSPSAKYTWLSTDKRPMGLAPGSSIACQDRICASRDLTEQEMRSPATIFYTNGCKCVDQGALERKFPHLVKAKDPNPGAALCAAGQKLTTDTKLTASTPAGRLNCIGLAHALAQGTFPKSLASSVIAAARPVCCK